MGKTIITPDLVNYQWVQEFLVSQKFATYPLMHSSNLCRRALMIGLKTTNKKTAGMK